MTPPVCTRCNVSMETGFALDVTHGGQLAQMWVGGETEPVRWLGMKTGSVEIKDRVKATFISYRCPECYRVEWYAPPVEPPNLLLRPAANTESDANELLRPASSEDANVGQLRQPLVDDETVDLPQTQS